MVLTKTSSGGVCVNHTTLQLIVPSLAFGGVGESGMGACRIGCERLKEHLADTATVFRYYD